MTHIANEVTISAPIDLVWDMTNDVESWPQLFTEYAAADVITKDDRSLTFRLTLKPDENGTQFSWVSERRIDPSTRTVHAKRIETGPFLYMNIRWTYNDTTTGVVMKWEQDFEVRPDLPFDDEAMAHRLNTNTRREMAHIKELVERAAQAQMAPA